MTALREIFATFAVEFDDKELKEGAKKVTSLQESLEELGDILVDAISNQTDDLIDNLGAVGNKSEDASRGIDSLADRGSKGKQSFVDFALATGGLESALRAAQPQVAAVIDGFLAMGRAAFSAVQFVIDATLEFADFSRELDLNARRLGVTSDQMQALGLFAADAGQDVDAVTDAMSTLQERARDAVLDPRSDPAQQLRRLGIEIPRSTEDLPDAITLLGMVSDGLQGMGNQSDRVGAAMTIFGDVGRELLPVLENGSEGIERYSDELERLGGGVSPEAIEASRELARAQARLDLAFTSLKSSLLADIIPPLERTVELLTDLSAWFSRNESVIEAVAITIGILAVVLGVVLIPFLIITAIMLLPLIIAFGLVVLVIGGLILVIEDLIVWFEGGNSVIGEFIESLLSMAGISMETVREEINAVFETLRQGYNNLAETLGLPTISAGVSSAPSDLPKGENLASASTTARRNGLLGLGGGDFLARVQAQNTVDQAGIRSQDLVDRQISRARERGAARTVNQENRFEITGGDPTEIARQIERVLDRQNRDAAEAVTQ